MSTLNKAEVDRNFDIFMPRLTAALSIDGERTPERASAAIHSLLMTAATCLVVYEGIEREAASVLIPEMIVAAYEAMADVMSTMHRGN